MSSILTPPTDLGPVVFSQNMGKYCSRCQLTLPTNAFNLRQNGKLSSYCTKCTQEYCRAHYVKNKAKANQRRYAHQKRTRQNLRQLLILAKDVPCADCGERHPFWAMDFDHRDPSTKEINPSRISAEGWSLKRTESELAKCDVVCALCHRYRTHGERRVSD